MTNEQERWVFDDSRYKGHTPIDLWVVRATISKTQEQVIADTLLEAHAPNILAEAVKLRAENERLRAVLMGGLQQGMNGLVVDFRAVRQALADTEGVSDG